MSIENQESTTRKFIQASVATALGVAAVGGAYALSRQEFIEKFHHKPEFAASLNEQGLAFGFVTNAEQFEGYVPSAQCGRSVIFEQVVGPDGHFTYEIEWAGIVYRAGLQCHDTGWYSGPDTYSNLTPPKVDVVK